MGHAPTARPATARAAATPPRRPLYLTTTRSRLRVTAAGESLVVLKEPGGRQQFPVSRIDRVVCGPRADWSGDALALCMKREVTVCWVTDGGQTLGEALPILRNPSVLHEALERFVERAGWQDLHENWRRSRRMCVLARWAADERRAGRPLPARDWEARKRTFVYGGAIEAGPFPKIPAWCRALVVRRTAEAGLRPRYWGYDATVLDLAADLTHLLLADIVLRAGSIAFGAADARTALFIFESSRSSCERGLRAHLGDLHRHVMRALDACR